MQLMRSFIAALSIIIPSISAATPEGKECDKLFRLLTLQKKHTSSVELKEFTVNWETRKETGGAKFTGLDIDGDGKEDSIVRYCGRGVGMLCTLSLDYSRGGHLETEGGPPFKLVQYKSKVYMVETIDGKTSPYTKDSETRISALKYKEIVPVCSRDYIP